MDYSINFPNLHIYLDNVGKNIMIGDFAIAYYGICIGLGMMGAIMLAEHLAKKTGQDSDRIYSIAMVGILSAIVGARLYFVAFQWDYYSQDLMKIFNLREGGLAIYGGILGAVLAVFIYTRIKNLKLGPIADVAAPAIALGQCAGRWGNFFNREAFGDYTDNLFAMQIPVSAVRAGEITQSLREHIEVIDGVSYIQVHPTFLYESMWNLAVMIFLILYIKHRKFEGEVFLMYLAAYGLGRIWIEALRTDQLLIPHTDIPVSQVLAGVMIVLATTWIVIKRIILKREKVEKDA